MRTLTIMEADWAAKKARVAAAEAEAERQATTLSDTVRTATGAASVG